MNRMKIFEWAEKHQYIVHGGIGFFLALIGTLWPLFVGVSFLLSGINGMMYAAIWFVAKEATDDTVHVRLKDLGIRKIWQGWSWSDFLSGIVGGLLGTVVSLLIFIL